MFKLKANQESFRVIHGPFAGRLYLRGVPYAGVPPGEKHKFEDLSLAEKKAETQKRRNGEPATVETFPPGPLIISKPKKTGPGPVSGE